MRAASCSVEGGIRPKAFAFKILSDETRVFGDRFIRCECNGFIVVISNDRTGERLAAGNPEIHYGLEYFAIETKNLEADIDRLKALGARLQDGSTLAPNGVHFAFLEVPECVRLELLQMP